ncbi:MAG: hypothetical protein GY835_00570 [bacterium]|nr:hypothetical protein [bacterium]
MKLSSAFLFAALLTIAIPTATPISAEPAPRHDDPAAPHLTMPGHPHQISAERAALVDALLIAKRSGDVTAARDLERRLALIAGNPSGQDRICPPAGVVLEVGLYPPGTSTQPRWQNNDILVTGNAHDEINPSMASLEDGTLFTAVELAGTDNRGADIYRSTDNGESWHQYYWLSSAEDITDLSLAAGEGSEDWLIMAFQYGTDLIAIFRIDLNDIYNWGTVTAHYNANGVANPRLVTDGTDYDYWYPYVVFNSKTATNWDLLFTRSLTYGQTWETATTLASYCGASGPWVYDGTATHPDIDYGSNMLYVAYDNYNPPCTVDSKEIYVISSSDLGGTWSSSTQLTSHSDDEFDPAICVTKSLPDSQRVVVAYSRLWQGADSDIWYNYTWDNGLSWRTNGEGLAISSYEESSPVLATSLDRGRVHVAYWHDGQIGYQSTDYLTPTLWTDEKMVNYGNYATAAYRRPGLTVNSSQGVLDEAAISWTDDRDGVCNIYADAPPTEGSGSIDIDPHPNELNAVWELLGPEGIYATGSGDTLLINMPDGDYTLFWMPVPDWSSPEPNPATGNLQESLTLVFNGIYMRNAPRNLGIFDVPADQGRYVRLFWERSGHDAPGTSIDITGYDIYRRQDIYKALPGTTVGGERELGWDSMGWISAHGEEIYQFVSPTLCDSTETTGICWSVFRIRATTHDPFFFFDAPPDSGYSIDNIFPAAPANLRLAAPNILAWDMVPDDDFNYYSVYASDTEEFTTYDLVGNTIDLELNVSGHEGRYLAVTARDTAGNESDPSLILWNGTGMGDTPPPTRYTLAPNVPNPFNPATTLRFGLPRANAVALRIYDLGGRVVRTLIAGAVYPAGEHQVTWDGTDEAGDPVASGVYLYRLDAGHFSRTRKMTLLK